MATVILVNQTTNGGEYLTSLFGTDYIGIFHVYDDGTIRTGPGILGSNQPVGNLLTPNPVAQGLPQFTNPSTAPVEFSGGINTVDLDTTPDGESLIFEEDKLSKDGYKKHSTAVYQSRYDNEVYTEVIDTTISELLNIRPTPPLEIKDQPAEILNTGQIRLIQGSHLQLNVTVVGKSILNPPLTFQWFHDGEPVKTLSNSNVNGTSYYECIVTNGARAEIQIEETPGGMTGTVLENELINKLENNLGYSPQQAFVYSKTARKLYTENKLTIYNMKEPESGFWNCEITDSEGNVVISEGVFTEVVNQFDLSVFNGNIVKNGDARQDKAFWTTIGTSKPAALAMKDERGPYYFGSQFKGDNSMALDGRYYPPSDFWDGVNPGERGQPVTKEQRYFFGGWCSHTGTMDSYKTYPLNNYSVLRQEIDLSEAIEIIDRKIVGVEDVRMDIWSWLGSLGWTEHIDQRYTRHYKKDDGKYIMNWDQGWGVGAKNTPLLSDVGWSPPAGNAFVTGDSVYDRYVGKSIGLKNLLSATGQGSLSIGSSTTGFVFYDFRHTIGTDWMRTQCHDKVYVTFEFYGGEEEKLNVAGSGELGQHVLENPYYYEELPHALYYYVSPAGSWYANSTYRPDNQGLLEEGGWFNCSGLTGTEPSWPVGSSKYRYGAYLDDRAGLSSAGTAHPSTNYFKWYYYDNRYSVSIGNRRGKDDGSYLRTADGNYDGVYLNSQGQQSGTGAGPRNWTGGGYKTTGGWKPFDFVYAGGGGNANSPETGDGFPTFDDRFTYGMLAFNGIRFNRIYKKTKFYFVEKPEILVPIGTRKVVVTIRFERDKDRGYEYSRLGYEFNTGNKAPRENGTYGQMIWCAATNINAHLNVKLQDDIGVAVGATTPSNFQVGATTPSNFQQ